MPRRRVLVYTEGSKTEPSYLIAWARRMDDLLALDISDQHGTPATLVNLALAAAEANARQAKRGRADRYDEVWCMFDVDEHPGVAGAMTLAEARGLGVAVSNPCIEFWFLLHWVDQTAHIERTGAQGAVRPYVGGGKTISAAVAEELIERHEVARERAQRLAVRHELNGSPVGSNPSSTTWRLIDALREPRTSR